MITTNPCSYLLGESSNTRISKCLGYHHQAHSQPSYAISDQPADAILFQPFYKREPVTKEELERLKDAGAALSVLMLAVVEGRVCSLGLACTSAITATLE